MHGAHPRPLGALALVALLLAPLSGHAQYGRTFRQDPELTRSDLDMVQKIVRQDLASAPEGTTRDWRNPESENSGTVTLIETFPSQGRDCRRVRYVVVPGKKSVTTDTASYIMTTCRLADGTWKIDSGAKPD